MQTTNWIGTLAVVIGIIAAPAGFAQNPPTPATPPPPVPATLVSQTPYTVVALDAHSRTWQSIATYSDPAGDGDLSYKTNAFQEIATGLNFHGVNNQWLPSSDAIQPVPGGGIATNAQFQAIFASDLNTQGAVDLLTPDGKRLTSQILGLSYFDTSSGQSVMIAELTNSVGQLLPSGNQVLYPNAFTGVQCDILYTHKISGLEQDLVIRAQLPPPGQWGLDPDTTHLQLLTEFFDPPAPQIQTLQLQDGDTDDQLNFGVMQMIRGKAFLMGDTATAPLVRKHWTVMAGRTFLIEEVPLKQLSSLLEQLPASSSGTSSLIPFTVRNSTVAAVGSPSPEGEGRGEGESQAGIYPKLALPKRLLVAKKGTAPLQMARLSTLNSNVTASLLALRSFSEGGSLRDRRQPNASHSPYPSYPSYPSHLSHPSHSLNQPALSTINSNVTASFLALRSFSEGGSLRDRRQPNASHSPYPSYPSHLSHLSHLSHSLNQLASLQKNGCRPRLQGLVLDYTLVTTQTNFDFQSDTTYFVTNVVNLSGTTTLEGGVVIKFATNSAGSIDILGGLSCLTTNYRPAIFTAQDDNTVGSTLPWSSGTPSGYYGYPMLTISSPTDYLHNLLIKYAFEGLYVDYDYLYEPLSDLQILNCNFGINSPTTSELSIYNVLLYNDYVAFHGGMAYDIEQSTIDECGTLMNMGYYGVTITNCVIANLSVWGTGLYSAGSGDYNGLYNTPSNTLSLTHSFTNTTNPFQTVGAGAHYLASGCNFANVGSSNIAASVIADIAQKTTYPPIVINAGGSVVTTNITLYPQAQRDTNSAPDLGYHYDPLDYALGNLYLTNATLTVNAGTAIGAYGSSGAYSCAITYGSQFICQGSPTNLNHIAYYNTVQEQANTNWSGPTGDLLVGNFGVGPPASVYLYCRFTDWSVPAQDVTHFYSENGGSLGSIFQDCQFHGGLIDIIGPGVAYTNCLLERVAFTDKPTSSQNLQNNLFWRGSFTANGRSISGIFADNVFDQTAITNTVTGYTETNNAYNTLTNASYPTLTLLATTNIGDVYLTNSSYLTGPLGNYYLPTNSLLLNAGSNALASQIGLYHYTTATNQVPETNSLVDLGYHYIALNAWGMPLDTDGDGVPDYLADTNGNGVYDPGVDPENWDSPMVVAWGLNTSGQCNVPLGLSNVVAVGGGLTSRFLQYNRGQYAGANGQAMVVARTNGRYASESLRHIRRPTIKLTPDCYAAVAFQGHALLFACRNCHHIGQPRGHVRLTEIIVTPRLHNAIL